MSKGPVMVSAEETAKNKAFLEQMAASGAERYIRRHSKQARWTHGITIIACILLCISGLFVFVPALAAAAGADGLIIEVHNDPQHALCDGQQSITPEAFASLAENVNKILPFAAK